MANTRIRSVAFLVALLVVLFGTAVEYASGDGLVPFVYNGTTVEEVTAFPNSLNPAINDAGTMVGQTYFAGLGGMMHLSP